MSLPVTPAICPSSLNCRISTGRWMDAAFLARRITLGSRTAPHKGGWSPASLASFKSNGFKNAIAQLGNIYRNRTRAAEAAIDSVWSNRDGYGRSRSAANRHSRHLSNHCNRASFG